MKGTLHHIEIYVSDLKKTIEFWDWLLTELGYEKYQEWNEGISYKFLDAYLVFVQAKEKFLDIGYHRKRIGLNHIAFHAGSRAMVDDLTNRLKERGVAVLYKDKHPFAGGKDHYAVFFEDPDRIKVELIAPSVHN
ncbi:MAG: VOC family protein [Bacteroidia bacterium]|nr:VOC family protein [Bacteroidia bacterium]